MYWTTILKDVPLNITLSMAVVVEDRIYSLDCFETQSKESRNAQQFVYVLDTSTYRWASLVIDLTVDTAPKYDDFTTVVHGEKIYTWGQDSRDRAHNVLYSLDTASLTLTRPAQWGRVPGRRVGHEACVVGDEMFVFGGRDEAWPGGEGRRRRSGRRRREPGAVAALDLRSMRWRRVKAKGAAPDLSTATFAIAAIGSAVYVFTESESDDLSLDWGRVWLFDTECEVWSVWLTHGQPPPLTNCVAVFSRGSFIYAFGGCWMGSDDIYRLDPERGRWTYLKASSGGVGGGQASVLFGVSCLVVGERVFVLGADDCAGGAGRRSVRVLDFAPTLQTLCMRAVLQQGLDCRRLPRRLRTQLSDMSTCKEDPEEDEDARPSRGTSRDAARRKASRL